jgi:hypothetical protein
MRDVTLHTCATAAPAVRRDGYTQEHIRDSEGITYGKDTKRCVSTEACHMAEMTVTEKQGTWNSVLPLEERSTRTVTYEGLDTLRDDEWTHNRRFSSIYVAKGYGRGGYGLTALALCIYLPDRGFYVLSKVLVCMDP